MINDNSNRRQVIAAILTACFLTLILGLASRILAIRLLTPISKIRIDPDSLEGFPIQIEDWTGVDLPTKETILRIIGADACVNRRYSRRSGRELVSFFLAATGVTAGLIGDAPEVCNIQAGWNLMDRRSAELALDDGIKLPCSVFLFTRGNWAGSEKKTVLCYYLADGQYYGNRSSLRLRVRSGPKMVNCIAQVQIVASSLGTFTTDQPTKTAYDFAIDSAISVASLIEDIKKKRNENEIHRSSQ